MGKNRVTHLSVIHLLDAIRAAQRLRRVPRLEQQHRASDRRHAVPETREVRPHVILTDHEVAHPEVRGVLRKALLPYIVIERVEQRFDGRRKPSFSIDSV